MVSKIVEAYLRSDYRAALLRAEAGKDLHALIYIESARIERGRKEDDEKIINFLEKLGDVDVVILTDREGVLMFEQGTFDNWIPMDMFRKICKSWKKEFSEQVYFYDSKINVEENNDDVNIIINSLNCILEVKDGLHFPHIHFVRKHVNRKYYNTLLQRLWRKHFRRHEINRKEPFSLHSCAIADRPTHRRAWDFIVTAEEYRDVISITETSSDTWVTKAEAVEMLNRNKKGVFIGGMCFKLDGRDSIDISHVRNHGVIDLQNPYTVLDIDNVVPLENFCGIWMTFDKEIHTCYSEDVIFRDEP